MADNVGVLPSTDDAAISVATDDVNGVHYPIYKTAIGGDGEATLINSDNPLPMSSAQAGELNVTMNAVLRELKLMNLYNAMAHNQELRHEDID